MQNEQLLFTAACNGGESTANERPQREYSTFLCGMNQGLALHKSPPTSVVMMMMTSFQEWQLAQQENPALKLHYFTSSLSEESPLTDPNARDKRVRGVNGKSLRRRHKARSPHCGSRLESTSLEVSWRPIGRLHLCGKGVMIL